MSMETAKELLKSIVKYNKHKDGDSGDAERDAGGELQTAAINHLRAEAGRSVELAEMFDEFERLLGGDVSEEAESVR